MSFQFDAESMQSRGSVETVWVKTLNKEPYGAKSYLSRESVDCNDRDAITILSQTSYSANGNVIDSFIHTERQPAPPGSVSASLIAMLCGAAK